MIRAASLDLQIDLLPFSRFLQSQGVAHRINEESGRQVIWVHGEREAGFVRQALSSYVDEMQTRPLQQPAATGRGGGTVGRVVTSLLRAFIASPVTLILVGICLLVAAVSALGAQAGRVEFLFYPLLDDRGLLPLLADLDSPGRVLRTLTPMFLHFGELHLIFNMLWLWYFGKQLEAIQPRLVFLCLVIATAFISNTTQYLSAGYNNFGGMSGVVYGLVGYAWVIHTFMPRSHLLLNSSMFVFFVVALVLMEALAGSWIATGAHVGGLVSGLLIGAGMVLYYRLVLKRQVIARKPDKRQAQDRYDL